jgi:hypothetical protein
VDPATQSLLAGMTPANYTLPSGWTLAAKQDFESGTVDNPGPGQALAAQAITSTFAHSGSRSAFSQINSDGAGVQWYSGITTREYYISYWDYGKGVLFNEEYVIQHAIKHYPDGGFQEMGYSIGAQTIPGYPLNSVDGGFEGAGQATTGGGMTVGFYGPSVGAYGSTDWNQWETWFKANTPGLADGFLRVYLNGKRVWEVANFNFAGNADMSGMGVEAGGWYTKNVGTSNGNRPNDPVNPGTCSLSEGQGSETGGWIGAYNASPMNPGNCPPAPPAFNRYIDDIILLQK